MNSSVNITLENIIQRKILHCQNDTNEELLSMNAGYIRGFNQMLLDMELSESAFITKYLSIVEDLRTIFDCWNEHPKENVDIDELSGYNNSIVDVLSLLNEKFLYDTN